MSLILSLSINLKGIKITMINTKLTSLLQASMTLRTISAKNTHLALKSYLITCKEFNITTHQLKSTK